MNPVSRSDLPPPAPSVGDASLTLPPVLLQRLREASEEIASEPSPSASMDVPDDGISAEDDTAITDELASVFRDGWIRNTLIGWFGEEKERYEEIGGKE
ncbi:hypothetical protein PPN31114_02282 [Pandoraea pneumonica]|jgi:hypothetical protein|uniref:Uncharacterized protein n=1 Tax=Pandoraea pneumonica TaxID=2508299 RepID=A0A5E4UVW1_9BURK|nr:hypothetical protein [Pandoraea pneumonica]VVE04088.1 hypothetical protein PPN31114_02282 [Pandoraea pneumonica]